MSRSFANDVLNAINAHIAVLDAQGTIVMVNEAWRRFAERNACTDRDFYVGTNYLAVCEQATRAGRDSVAEAVMNGILELLHGSGRGFAVEYPCHSPSERHWFIAQGTRFTHRDRTYLVVSHEEITARKLAETKVAQAEATLRNVLNALPVGVWILDAEGRIVQVNPAGERIWGGRRFVGPAQFGEYKGWWLSTGRPVAPEEWAAARAVQKGETSLDEEILIEGFDGSRKIILNSGIPLRDDAERISGAIIVNQDITVRKRMEEELREAKASVEAVNRELQDVLAREQRKARTDDLTGLGNRRHFFGMSQQLFEIAQRYGLPFAVFMFDIDHFKAINDRFGHQAGDGVLIRIAEIAREHTRHSDVLARYGGEEFIVAVPNTDAAGALAVAEHLREAVAATPQALADAPVHVTISAGIAQMQPGGDSLDALIARADAALYAAKRAGRNRSRIAGPEPPG